MEENDKIEEEKVVVENTEVVNNIPTQNTSSINDGNESKGLSIASLVLGISAFFVTKTGLISLACAILAIVFGVKGQKKAGKGMAKAGMILGIIHVSLSCALAIIFGVFLGVALIGATM